MQKITLLLTAIFIGFISLAQQRQPIEKTFESFYSEKGNSVWAEFSDFTATDINGNTHHLQEYIDAGKYVVIDFSATWCGPCWQLHQSHKLDDLYETYGPEGTDEVVVLWVEVDNSTTIEDIEGNTSGTQGDWTVGGTWPIPIINDRTPLNSVSELYSGGVPSVFGFCPNGGVYRDVTQEMWASAEAVYNKLTSSCPSVEDSPVVNFTGPLNGFLGVSANFEDASISATEISSWEWTFEGGTPATATGESVTAKWETTGTFNITLTVTNSVGSSYKTKSITISESNFDNFHVTFEECIDFAKDVLPYSWKSIDIDGANTYSAEAFDFPEEGSPSGFVVFNYSALGVTSDELQAYEGDKYAVSIASPQGQSDNWLISPKISLDTQGDMKFNFYAKSFTHQYGAERFKVGVSTTDDNPESFSFISEGDYVEAPITFTEYSYDLSEYAGQDIYVAIQCVSNDAWLFMVDEITISGFVEIGKNNRFENINIYPNPTKGTFCLNGAEKTDVEILNNLGKVVTKRNNICEKEIFDISFLESGIYFVKVKADNEVYSKKIIVE